MSDHIATEVLEAVICFLLQDPTKPVRANAILRVYERWHGIGALIIWTNIALSNAKQARGLYEAPTSQNLSLIKTLTIRPAPLDPQTRSGMPFGHLDEDQDLLEQHGNIATRDLMQALEEFCNIIPLMEHLLAPSFQIGPVQGHAEPWGFRMPRRLLQQLVMSLPSSVQHLEIDTRGFESATPEVENVHICVCDSCTSSTTAKPSPAAL